VSGFERLAAKAVFSLPIPLLRLLSGGGVVYANGRTLDPRLQFMAAQARAQARLISLTPEEARRSARAGFAPLAAPLPEGVDVETLMVPGADGERPARLYRPARGSEDRPVLVYAHMGGGVLGDLDTCDAFCGLLTKAAGCPVLSVDYRLAPEHRFPAGYHDVLAAYRWARDNADRLGAVRGQAAIGGDSMGGNFAALVCQSLRREGEPQPLLQMLIYPAVDLADDSPSMRDSQFAFPLDAATMAWFMGHYLNPEDAPADPRLSPAREADLSGLAPAIVVTAGFDPLHDQGEAYARRLHAAGVPVDYRCYDSLAHAFTSFTGVVPAAAAACAEIADLTRRRLETH
jgi:acetyl esterase